MTLALQGPGADVLRDLLASRGDPRDLQDPQITVLRALFEEETGAGLWCFSVFICGLTKMTPHLHREICEFLSKWGQPGWRRMMMMVPRGSFKTSIGSKALPLWVATKDPEVAIGIFSAAESQAKSWLRSIRQILESSRLYHTLWPERLPPGVHWRDRERGKTTPKSWNWGDSGMVLRRDSAHASEPTFEPYGIGGSHTGRHYSHRIMDDMIGENAADSPLLIEDSIHFVDHARALERPPEGGCELVNCTPWAYRDCYSHLLTKWPDDYKVYRRALLEHPETGEPDVINGVSIFPEQISTAEAKQMHRRDPFVFACLPADSPILMEDWTERPISSLQVGDRVIGVNVNRLANSAYRSRLQVSTVEAVVCREEEVFEHDLSDGTQIRCTAEHKWWNGLTRQQTHGKSRNLYVPIGASSTSRRHPRQGFAVRLRDPLPPLASLSREQIFAAGYLSAIFDGEGHISRDNQLVIASQSPTRNPAVCEAIRAACRTLGIVWTEGSGGSGEILNFYAAGVQERFKFWTWCRPSRKRAEILASLQYFYRTTKPKVIATRSLGIMPVYAMQTSTRNYVAHLCVSSNSQYQCIPQAGRQIAFQREWFRPCDIEIEPGGQIVLSIPDGHYDPTRVVAAVAGQRAPNRIPLHWCDRALLLDPAPTKKGEKSSEPRARNALVALAQDPWGRIFTLQAVALREDPVTVMNAAVLMLVYWKIRKFGIEEVNFSKVYAPLWNLILKVHHPRLEISWLSLLTKGEDKDVRIRRLLAPHREGLWYYYEPRSGYALQEAMEYPNSETRDLIDAMAYYGQALSRPPTPDERAGFRTSAQTGRDERTGY